ncbi:MAG: bifunctional riboflavin kinase/FAD synthetase [Prevotella sp.]|nr:bifunctional riboflavin kinase/FAD synthetase [Prevotella sp.]
MKVISLTDETRLKGSYAATIGFFDGVHRGHCYVLEQLCQQAKEHGWPSMAITFDRHPRQVVDTAWHPLLLTTLDEKVELLRQTGIDLLVVLPFDEAMARLTAHDFMQQVLKERLGVSLLLTGYDNRFGHRTPDTHEGFSDYVRYGQEMGIEVVCGEGLQVPPFLSPLTSYLSPHTSHISSSLIRRLISEGRVDEAAQCLGRPYNLCGIVEHGFEQGRKMGFPTANMKVDSCRLVPADGVYAVSVHPPLTPPVREGRLDASPSIFSPSTFTGITNIGMRPTFDGHQRSIETHILDFEGDLYGQRIEIAFVARLRDEKHFDSAEELAQQMARDAEEAKKTKTKK